MASTKTRRTGKEGLHTRVKQGNKAVKDRYALDEQMRHFEDQVEHDYVDNRVEQYRLVNSTKRPELTLAQKMSGLASDTGYDSVNDMLDFIDMNGLKLTHKDLPDNAPVAEADELAQVLCNMARICGWRLTYKLERL